MMEGTAEGVILEPLDMVYQPLGVFGLPAGMLLLPDTENGMEVALQLRAGRRPKVYSGDTHFYHLALVRADPGKIIRALPGHGALHDFNELVLNPTLELFTSLLGRCDGDFALLVNWQGYLNGYCQLPDFKLARTNTVAAVLCSSHATRLLEVRDEPGAAELLREAIAISAAESEVFAAGLRADLAQLLLDDRATKKEAMWNLQLALDALGETDLSELAAEVHLNLGMAFHDEIDKLPTAGRDAARHYMAVTRLVTEQTSPYAFGTAHMNLALTYLSMPMTDASDQLRYGIAIASLQKAVAAFDPDVFLEQWARARLNLANALVYAPSVRQADNLVEAVEIYEELLQIRDRFSDPVGFARVCANQGNALGHLGMFSEAKAKLHDARAIFEEFEMTTEISAIREVLDHIERERVGRGDSK